MADASDSKSDAGNSVWVQVPFPALKEKPSKFKNVEFTGFFLCLICADYVQICVKSIHFTVKYSTKYSTKNTYYIVAF